MKHLTLTFLLLLVSLAVPAVATVGLVDEPRWVEGGLCVDLTTTEGATVAVRSVWWAVHDVVVVGWAQGDASATDPECAGSQAVRTSEPGPTEVWTVFIPVPCPDVPFTSTRGRWLYVYESGERLMSFDMGRQPDGATGTCIE